MVESHAKSTFTQAHRHGHALRGLVRRLGSTAEPANLWEPRLMRIALTTAGSRKIVIFAVVVAVIGFLSIHQYLPYPHGIVENAMRGEIYLTTQCETAESSHEAIDRLLAEYANQNCGFAIPYKWLLALCVIVAATGFVLPRRE